MLIRTAQDIPDALKALANDLRRLGESTWADRITLTMTMRKQGRALATTARELLTQLAQTHIPQKLGYTHRIIALQHAATALQIGNRLKPSSLQQTARNVVWHPEGFYVRVLELQVVYQEGPRGRTITIPLEPADAGMICRLNSLHWDHTPEPLPAPARDAIQHRIIAALLYLDTPCRIYCE